MPQGWFELDSNGKKILKQSCRLYKDKKLPITKLGHGETQATLSCYGDIDKNEFDINISHVFHRYNTKSKSDSNYGQINFKNVYGKDNVMHLHYSGMEDKDFDKILDTFEIPINKFKRTNP